MFSLQLVPFRIKLGLCTSLVSLMFSARFHDLCFRFMYATPLSTLVTSDLVYLCLNPGPHTYKYISTTPVYSIVLRLNIALLLLLLCHLTPVLSLQLHLAPCALRTWHAHLRLQSFNSLSFGSNSDSDPSCLCPFGPLSDSCPPYP